MRRAWWVIALGALAGACGNGEETGQLDVLLEPEGTVLDGVPAGEGPGQMRDGWSASFERYVVVIGDVDLQYASNPDVAAHAEDLFAVDLTTLPASGLSLWSLDALREGDWTPFYSVVGASGAMRDASVEPAVFDEMEEGNWSYLIEGRIEKPDGMSCPPAALADPGGRSPNGEQNAGGDDCYDHPLVEFRLGVDVDTLFGPCGIDGQDGFNVPAGGTQTIALSLHGDHIFFNGFSEGQEGGVLRLAQWLADSDLDLDGQVSREELQSISPSDLPELDERYDLGGPIEVHDMWDYVRAQLKTQGHFQGEGECEIDGMPQHHHDDHEEDGHE